MGRRSRPAPRPVADPPPPRSSQDAPLPWSLLLGGVGVAAMVVRLIHVTTLSRTPLFDVLLGDSKRYVDWGSAIAAGDWQGSGAFYQAPLYPHVLATIFSIFGASAQIVRIVQAIFGSLACVLVAMAGRRLFDWRTGVIAGVALALYPPAIFFDGHVQKASLDLLLMAALLFALAAYDTEHRRRWIVGLGATLGCLLLNRENARALYPVLALWLLWEQREASIQERARTVLVFTLATMLPIAPVAIRNYSVSGDVLLSTSQLGPNFYVGNHAGASGVYEPLVPEHGSVIYEQEDAVRLATAAAGRPLSPAEVSNYWLLTTLREIRADLRGWARLMGRKLLLSVNTIEVMDTESLDFHADYSPALRALTPLTFGVLLPLAVLGIAITSSDVRRLSVLYGIAVVFLASVVLFFVLARYRYPVVPVLALFAGAALANVRGAWRERRRSLLVGAVTATAVAVVVNLPMRATTDETAGNFGRELLRLDRAREAVSLLQRAVDLVPEDAAMRRDLALAYLKSGDAGAALREYRQVIEREPHDAEHHREMAVAAEAAGDSASALTSLRTATSLEPANPATYIRLGDFLMRAGQTGEARKTYEQALAASSVSPVEAVRLQTRIASLEIADGQWTQALIALQDASARAHASGQTAVAADVDSTIEAVRHRSPK